MTNLYDLNSWVKVCKTCNETLDLFNFHASRQEYLGVKDICIRCSRVAPNHYKKEGRIVRRKQKSRLSIESYQDLNNGFMTDAEIKKMYSSLKSHMLLKYGRYDEEVIQRSILRGLKDSRKYDPKRASKLVWFQTNLFSIYMYEIDPKYNRTIRHHYSLDWEGENETINADLEKAVAFIPEDFDDETDEAKLIRYARELRTLISHKKYPHLWLKLTGAPSWILCRELGIAEVSFNTRVHKERADFVEGLPERWKVFLKDRKVPVRKKKYKTF